MGYIVYLIGRPCPVPPNGVLFLQMQLTLSINSRQKMCTILCVVAVNGNFFPIRVCGICEKRQKKLQIPKRFCRTNLWDKKKLTNLSLTPSKICKKILQIKIWLN